MHTSAVTWVISCHLSSHTHIKLLYKLRFTLDLTVSSWSKGNPDDISHLFSRSLESSLHRHGRHYSTGFTDWGSPLCKIGGVPFKAISVFHLHLLIFTSFPVFVLQLSTLLCWKSCCRLETRVWRPGCSSSNECVCVCDPGMTSRWLQNHPVRRPDVVMGFILCV